MMSFRFRLQHIRGRMRSSRSNHKSQNVQRCTRRYATTTKAGTAEQANDAKYISRIRRMNDKLPRFLRHYTTPLLSAPVSHITAFLVLHEITAMVPLIGLASFFHYTSWLPEQIVNGQWVQAGIEKWGRYFQKKGWAQEQQQQPQQQGHSRDQAPQSSPMVGGAAAPAAWTQPQTGEVSISEVKSRGAGWNVVLEVATAWAVVKALLPVRIVGSVWLTPWFARVGVVPFMRMVGRAGGKAV